MKIFERTYPAMDIPFALEEDILSDMENWPLEVDENNLPGGRIKVTIELLPDK